MQSEGVPEGGSVSPGPVFGIRGAEAAGIRVVVKQIGEVGPGSGGFDWTDCGTGS